MDTLDLVVGFLNDILWSYVLIIMLIGLGIYFSLATKFVQLRLLGEMIRLMGEGVGEKTGKQISSFQAFCISTASRVGVGNIAGIAIAVVSGGPGAIFWMWVIAALGAASGFVESTLAQIYKVKDEQGSYRGGPAYYIKNALDNRRAAIFFAVLISITFGLIFNSVQANTIALALNSAYGIDRLVVGLVLASLTAAIIFGGVRRIAKVMEWVVPFMASIYILTALCITLLHISLVPQVLYDIVTSAFGMDAVFGGGIGAAMMTGIKRGLFSNEAGMGSVPNAAATADVSHPVKQGLIQALGVFVDTMLVCTSSAFIVLLAGNYMDSGLTGIELVQSSLALHLGPWAAGLLALFILLFAFSSIVGNYYYGESNIGFFEAKPKYLFGFRLAVIIMVVFGSIAKINLVWDMADLFMALMAITNLVAITLLSKFAFIALKDYSAQKKAGVKDPVFTADIIPDQKGIAVWRQEK